MGKPSAHVLEGEAGIFYFPGCLVPTGGTCAFSGAFYFGASGMRLFSSGGSRGSNWATSL